MDDLDRIQRGRKFTYSVPRKGRNYSRASLYLEFQVELYTQTTASKDEMNRQSNNFLSIELTNFLRFSASFLSVSIPPPHLRLFLRGLRTHLVDYNRDSR